MLQIDHLNKSFFLNNKPLHILSDLQLSVEKGEKIAIIGPSGSGKSTFLSLLAGLDKPTSGSITINGEDIVKLNEKKMTQFRSENIGIVFQQFHLLNQLTAFENVHLPLELNHSPLDTQEKVLETLESVQLLDRKDHYPHQLSGGEKQRVAIARSLVVEPNILLADEPSGSLDAKTGQQVINSLFKLVTQKNTTLLLVTHNLELTKLCDRSYKLEKGRLL